jgi:hypothetical protein
MAFAISICFQKTFSFLNCSISAFDVAWRRQSACLSVAESAAPGQSVAFAERVLPRAADLWVQAALEHRQRFQQLFFPEESRSTEKALLEPA